MHVIQFKGENESIRLGIVKFGKIYPLQTHSNLYELAMLAILNNNKLREEISCIKKLPVIDYSKLISSSKILPPITHRDAAHVLVSGTGLTHLNSVIMRHKMRQNESLTDAKNIYQSGLEGGKPSKGQVGTMPEWFFRGFGHQIKTSNQFLTIPSYALSAGEEAELVVIYIINQEGTPYRVGFTLGNEFSDHILEKKNHYYLAQSKLRECAIGPEIYVGDLPNKVYGNISIEREGKVLWKNQYKTGSDHMIHSLENIEYHLFKYELFCQPGDIHVLFLGADKISFSDHVTLQAGDTVTIESDMFQLPLVNTMQGTDHKKQLKVVGL